MGLTHVLTAIGLALAAAVSSGDSSQHALLAQPTCTIDVPWEDELAAQRDCKWAKCHLCWKSVWYIKETHVLPNITIGTVAKGTHLTCSWLSHARNDTTCAAITDAVPSIVVNLTAGHRVGDVCRSLALCKSRKPQKPRKMSKGIGSICTHCYYGVKYVNATRHISGLPEKAVKIGVQVLCPHCPHYRKACHKFVRSVPTILKELETGKTCAKAICKDVGFCGRKHRAHGERPTPDDDDADDMSLDEDADDEEAAHFSKVTSIVAAGVVTVGIVFLTAKVFQRRRVQGVEAEYVAVPQQGR
ncbi:hypothetical protein SDRG_00504 [Saprolegnia diclina VS20]|uniref:Saposin B-type domain-containing protein n=1 Tax=Saprolegnia diclina (strain VS20) TaxID=1156394 RepID=T0SBI1_SAPDV|nr:hypothetical protein SDRG_00504 [Saprolegnia diclina VS20]EQC42783.1 hypothetical protein SDRG_00504 [Saprolegnia diclina VS20]|eukprot:XP_008604206.1 hypothetical protein SDRG_00504 [Saprolegnia diclina VS20]